ncbi:Hypothetical protein A7982_08905 [Minicystis rosea]|nr:Hypothetical protein A7982_08905 [Minicystis rosea]
MLFWRESAAVVLVAGLVAGCAGARDVGLGSLPPGTTAIRVMNHVAAPGELDRLIIAVDGQAVPLTSIPPEGGDPALIAKLRLPAGPHTIAVRAKARAARSEVLVVGAQQPFHVGRGPAAITVDVRSLGESFDPVSAAPIAVSLAIEGGRMAPEIGVAPPEDRDQRCAALLPIPRAICRAAVDLDEATRKNDIVAALCVRDKLTEMRRLALASESGRGDAITMAEAEVAALSKQVDLCSGMVAAPQPDGVRVLPPRR